MKRIVIRCIAWSARSGITHLMFVMLTFGGIWAVRLFVGVRLRLRHRTNGNHWQDKTTTTSPGQRTHEWIILLPRLCRTIAKGRRICSLRGLQRGTHLSTQSLDPVKQFGNSEHSHTNGCDSENLRCKSRAVLRRAFQPAQTPAPLLCLVLQHPARLTLHAGDVLVVGT